MRPRSIIITAFAAIVLFTLAAMFVLKEANRSRASIEVYGQVPAFEFTERSGTPFGLKNLEGSLNVVDFIFTKCPGACPVMSGEMLKLYKLYEGSDKVRFVSISVDPDTDTLPVLTEYAESFGVTDDRWVFLRELHSCRSARRRRHRPCNYHRSSNSPQDSAPRRSRCD